eukprot:4848282-Pleurochrysis_carterae.AAC.3
MRAEIGLGSNNADCPPLLAASSRHLEALSRLPFETRCAHELREFASVRAPDRFAARMEASMKQKAQRDARRSAEAISQRQTEADAESCLLYTSPSPRDGLLS